MLYTGIIQFVFEGYHKTTEEIFIHRGFELNIRISQFTVHQLLFDGVDGFSR